jgi:hypothetical protein
MKILSDREKLTVLKEVKKYFKIGGKGTFLCRSIFEQVEKLGIDKVDKRENVTDQVVHYFPELNKYFTTDEEKYHYHGWFGDPFLPGNKKKRYNVVCKMIEDIEKNVRWLISNANRRRIISQVIYHMEENISTIYDYIDTGIYHELIKLFNFDNEYHPLEETKVLFKELISNPSFDITVYFPELEQFRPLKKINTNIKTVEHYNLVTSDGYDLTFGGEGWYGHPSLKSSRKKRLKVLFKLYDMLVTMEFPYTYLNTNDSEWLRNKLREENKRKFEKWEKYNLLNFFKE